MGAAAGTAAGSVLALDVSAVQVSIITAVTQGVVVAALTFAIVSCLVYAYRWGNSRRRSPT